MLVTQTDGGREVEHLDMELLVYLAVQEHRRKGAE
jgi:hypothetical protein